MSATRTAEESTFGLSEQNSPDDLDMRARKRIQVGLSPRRPTAKAALQRPPDYQTLPLPPLALALVLVGIVLLTTGLVAANLLGVMPEWLPSWQRNGATLTNAPRTLTTVGNGTGGAGSYAYTLQLADDFSQATSELMQGSRENEWRTELIPTESVYRMTVWPNHLAWSLLGQDDLQGYRLQTNTLVDGQTPGGYAGIIARYQDERNFYLFAVDGSGRFLVQQQAGEQLTTLQPWTGVPFLNSAGSANALTVEDDGTQIRFYGNSMLLFTLDTLPAASPPVTATGVSSEQPAVTSRMGLVGLAGGAQGEDVAEVEFDWFQLYQLVPATTE